MLAARALQTLRIQSGSSLSTDNAAPADSVVPAQDRGNKGKGQGKVIGQGQEQGPRRRCRKTRVLTLATSPHRRASAAPSHACGSAARTIARSNRCPEGSCGKHSANTPGVALPHPSAPRGMIEGTLSQEADVKAKRKGQGQRRRRALKRGWRQGGHASVAGRCQAAAVPTPVVCGLPDRLLRAESVRIASAPRARRRGDQG